MSFVRIALSFFLLVTLSLSTLPDSHAAARQKVFYTRTVDGDTLKVKTTTGQLITLRLLLTDTPESVKPGTAVQPYSLEAKSYLTKLAQSGNLSIQYDTGSRTDRYGRHLVYLYSGSTMLNERLVYNGYARVGYIYQQHHYLSMLNHAQSHAKLSRLRIWKTAGYVNPYGEGFIVRKAAAKPAVKKPVVKKPVVTKPVVTKPVFSTSPTSVKLKNAPLVLTNCTAVRKYYPYGITYKHPSYKKKLDRDHDNVACEKN
ncbi:endonuclease [Macrococcus equipercicus]|uniref:Endonuclease n=1 Tax=Macrococcus equipercicus TaxID=69967 RepID=A0ABQ6R877_9STAP|nr:thermonuclease family protein [Macrococcus equipercicus]KAA1039319.1 endonuclease [Macrococcus equipercicus]